MIELVELENQTVAIFLNRPEKRNALNQEILEEFIKVMGTLKGKRVLYLLGKGVDFCTGMDLRDSSEETLDLIQQAFRTIEQAPQITIACVNGRAMGGGAGLALAADFLLMETGSLIAFPEVQRGIIPAVVSTLLRRKLPESLLKKHVLLGDPITAKEAVASGLAYKEVDKDELLREADKIAAKALLASPDAVYRTKKLLNEIYDSERVYKLAREAYAHPSEDAQEGIAAFLEKRPPKWYP